MSASPESVPVRIHPSQFPDAVAEALRASVRERRMDHRFHYESPLQARRWLRVHTAYSPACTDPKGTALYADAASAAAERLAGHGPIDVISLGSGGGAKDARLLAALGRDRRDDALRYIPVDVSPGLALTSRQAALGVGLGPGQVIPCVADLAGIPDWAAEYETVLRTGARRMVLFYGMLPNFPPETTTDRLAGLLRPGDLLLLSANLAPGGDYPAGVRSVQHLYDNPPTREWLSTVLHGLGAGPGDFEVRVRVAPCPFGSGLLRIEARAVFTRPTEIAFEDAAIHLGPGDDFLLFYSYRHTPEIVDRHVGRAGLRTAARWIHPAGDEGVFLAERLSRHDPAPDGNACQPA